MYASEICAPYGYFVQTEVFKRMRLCFDPRSYKRKSLKLVVSVKIVIYESVKLFGKNILEKTEMTRVDSYYGHVGVVELVDGVEKSAVAAYADEQFGIVIVVAGDRKSFIFQFRRKFLFYFGGTSLAVCMKAYKFFHLPKNPFNLEKVSLLPKSP